MTKLAEWTPLKTGCSRLSLPHLPDVEVYWHGTTYRWAWCGNHHDGDADLKHTQAMATAAVDRALCEARDALLSKTGQTLIDTVRDLGAAAPATLAALAKANSYMERAHHAEAELERAHEEARVGEEALRKRIAELERDVALAQAHTEPRGGPIYAGPFPCDTPEKEDPP